MLNKPEYPNLDAIMQEKKITAFRLARMIGMDAHTMVKRLNGERQMKLDEALLIKSAVKTDLPLEKLFERR